MKRFGAPGGLGETLQEKLLERQEKTANWVRVPGQKLTRDFWRGKEEEKRIWVRVRGNGPERRQRWAEGGNTLVA